MKIRRTTIAVILAVCAALTLCACGNDMPAETTEQSTAATTAATDVQTPVTVESALTFSSNGDGESCTVTAAHASLSGDVKIPSEHGGLAVTAIGKEAFFGCEKITSVTVPSGVTDIGDLAFARCSALEKITLSEDVQKIGEFVFFECGSLKEIAVSTRNQHFKSVGGALYTSLCDALVAVPAATEGEFTVADGTYEIAPCAFISCSAITKITLPDTIEEIGEYAFDGCSALTEINIPDGVGKIGEYAFAFCTSLESVSLPQSVTKISDGTFWCCDAVKEIALPVGITEIGEYALADCGLLEKIYFGGTLAEWEAVEKAPLWDGGAKYTVICSDGEITSEE